MSELDPMTEPQATGRPDSSADDEAGEGGEESSAPKQHVTIEEKVEIARATATRLFELLGAPPPQVECRAEEDQVIVQLTGLDAALVPTGDTRGLESLQFILNKAINRFSLDRTRLSLDTEGFRRRRPEGLDKVAAALAAKAHQLGKPMLLGPLGQGDLRFLTAQLSRTAGLAVVHHGLPERRRLVIAPQAVLAELAEMDGAGDAPQGEGHGRDAGGHRRRRRRR